MRFVRGDGNHIGSEAELLFGRYGRGQFFRDAQRLGINPASAFSRAALRRRRDRLLLIHHPDRGGEKAKAAEINAIYERMLKWLDGQGARWRQAKPRDAPMVGKVIDVSSPGARTAKLGALALAAVAAYAAFRRGGGKRQ